MNTKALKQQIIELGKKHYLHIAIVHSKYKCSLCDVPVFKIKVNFIYEETIDKTLIITINLHALTELHSSIKINGSISLYELEKIISFSNALRGLTIDFVNKANR